MSTRNVAHPTPPDAPAHDVTGHALLNCWPSALGLGVAVLVLATGVADRDTGAIAVTAAAVCYLAAAALGRPWVAWASVGGASLVAVASEAAGLPRWAGLGLTALVLVVVGIQRGASRPTLTQAGHVIGFGALAVLALTVDPRLGLLLAGLTLAAHAVWDAIHYYRNEVVPRSLAEACMLLDVPLGLGLVALALAG